MSLTYDALVSSSDPPFGGEFPFGDLSKLFSGLGGAGGQDPWVQASEIASTIASDGGTEPNLDPSIRIAVEDLARVADLHVRQVPGLSLPSDARIAAVTRKDWATRSVSSYRPFFERFAEALGSAGPTEGGMDPMAMMMGQMFSALGPMLVSASAGAMLGHLGQKALGQYDLPVPRPGSEILVCPSGIDEAATDWGVDRDQLRLYVLVHELATHAVLSMSHVGKRLEELFLDFAAAFRPNQDKIGELFASGGFANLTDFSEIQAASEQMSDPDVILDLMRSPAHDLLMPQLDALVAAVMGFVDHAVVRACGSLVPELDQIRQEIRYRMVDVSDADRFMEKLLGINITEDTLNRGDRFIEGIVDRAGDAGLARLWADELDLPTAAEVNAPGLWLARIGLDPDLPEGTTLEVPDDLSGLEDL